MPTTTSPLGEPTLWEVRLHLNTPYFSLTAHRGFTTAICQSCSKVLVIDDDEERDEVLDAHDCAEEDDDADDYDGFVEMCECEQDWNCGLHANRVGTWIETRYDGLDDERGAW